ncbi:MAG: DUF1893 domain-containing protein [Bacteroidales bacterium]
MQHLIDLLHQGNYACVIAQGDDIRTFTQRGVNDLWDILEQNPSFLSGAEMADKIVGKAAAALIIKGGIAALYTDIISQSALNLLQASTVNTTYKSLVPYIERRDKQGICPLEKATQASDDVEEIFQIIAAF